jgi:cobalamin synthase
MEMDEQERASARKNAVILAAVGALLGLIAGATLWVVTGAWLYLLMAPVFVGLAWYRYR